MWNIWGGCKSWIGNCMTSSACFVLNCLSSRLLYTTWKDLFCFRCPEKKKFFLVVTFFLLPPDSVGECGFFFIYLSLEIIKFMKNR